eukprot:TRINITY_DN12210_c0_g1_i1.p1 TRINITY_DN12210_c0_g1~~TRINITY_DN12210_c0_g1_i1.p1  ORF type:complete len:1037 (+),score=160.73 TRINITY_DN12210_c0_g1_i1:110-3220(+)
MMPGAVQRRWAATDALRDAVQRKITLLTLRGAAVRGAQNEVADSQLSGIIERHHDAAAGVRNPRAQVRWVEGVVAREVLKRQGPLGPQTATALLKTLTQHCDSLPTVVDVVAKCSERGAMPGTLFPAALKRCWDARDRPAVERLAIALKVHGLNPAPIADSYCVLIQLCAAADDADSCVALLEDMRGKQLPLDPRQWTRPSFVEAVLRLLLKHDRAEPAGQFLAHLAALVGLTKSLRELASAHSLVHALGAAEALPPALTHLPQQKLALALSPLNPVIWTDDQLAIALRKFTSSIRSDLGRRDAAAASAHLADAKGFISAAKASGQVFGGKAFAEAVQIARLCDDWVAALDFYEQAREAGKATEKMVTQVLAAMATSKRVGVAKAVLTEHLSSASSKDAPTQTALLYTPFMRVCEGAEDLAAAEWAMHQLRSTRAPILKPAYVALLNIYRAKKRTAASKALWREYCTQLGAGDAFALFDREVVFAFARHMCAAGDCDALDAIIRQVSAGIELHKTSEGGAGRRAGATLKGGGVQKDVTRIVNTLVYFSGKLVTDSKAVNTRHNALPVLKHAYSVALRHDLPLEGSNVRMLLDVALALGDILLATRVHELMAAKGRKDEIMHVVRQALIASPDPELIVHRAQDFLFQTADLAHGLDEEKDKSQGGLFASPDVPPVGEADVALPGIGKTATQAERQEMRRRHHGVMRLLLRVFEVLVTELGMSEHAYTALLRCVGASRILVAGDRGQQQLQRHIPSQARPLAQALFRSTVRHAAHLLRSPDVLIVVLNVLPSVEFFACFAKPARGVTGRSPEPAEVCEIVLDHLGAAAATVLDAPDGAGRASTQNHPGEVAHAISACLALVVLKNLQHVNGGRYKFFLSALEAVLAFCSHGTLLAHSRDQAPARAEATSAELRSLLIMHRPAQQASVRAGLDLSPFPIPKPQMTVAQRCRDVTGLVREILELLIDELQSNKASRRDPPQRLLTAVVHVKEAYPDLQSWAEVLEELTGQYVSERQKLRDEVAELKRQLESALGRQAPDK